VQTFESVSKIRVPSVFHPWHPLKPRAPLGWHSVEPSDMKPFKPLYHFNIASTSLQPVHWDILR